MVWLRQFDTIDFSCLQDQLREHNAFWAGLCNVLYGVWLLSGLNHIWFGDSSLKFICPQDFESGLLQDVVSMFFFGICSVCRSFFCHVRVRKCDSCCDNGTGWGGWGGWYQASWSGVPASWGFEVVPCNIVLWFRQLQIASNCFKLLQTGSTWFKLLRTGSNCFELLRTVSICFKLLETALNYFKLLETDSKIF